MLYPIFLKLSGKPVLVVGAGTVASAKIRGLLSAEACVHVVAQGAGHDVVAMHERGELELSLRAFEPRDVDGKALVIAATNDPGVNEAILRSGGARGILVNVVDDPKRCDFYVPSVVRRGRLQVAISTEGASPGFARRLRKELEGWLHPSLGDYVELLAQGRKRIRQAISEPEARRSANEALVESGARASLERGDLDGARAAIARVLGRFEQKQSEK